MQGKQRGHQRSCPERSPSPVTVQSNHGNAQCLRARRVYSEAAQLKCSEKELLARESTQRREKEAVRVDISLNAATKVRSKQKGIILLFINTPLLAESAFHAHT